MERTINFIQVVYEYYKNEPPYSDFTLEELLEKEIPTGKKAASVPVAEFEQAARTLPKISVILCGYSASRILSKISK